MNRTKYIYYKLIFYLVIGCTAWTQFIEVNVEIDIRRLNDSEKQLFDNFSEEVKNYYLNTQFGTDISDLNIELFSRFIIESITYGGNQPSINAQAIISNNSDQYFYAKSLQFPYSQGKKMYFTSSFDPLVSFLDYYAYILISSELDTYDYLGGTSFYNKAIELSKIGEDSDWSNGWGNRRKKVKKIKNNEYLRSMRFNFFLCLDELNTEDVNIDLIHNSMIIFYEDFEMLDNKIGNDKETLQFFKAYNEKIAELLSALQMDDALNLLMIYDNDHKDIYKSYLKN